MKRTLILLFLALLPCCMPAMTLLPLHNQAVAGLLNRIGGKGTSKRIVTQIDASLSPQADVFVISADKSGRKPIATAE